jgi:hypothetical protein
VYNLMCWENFPFSVYKDFPFSLQMSVASHFRNVFSAEKSQRLEKIITIVKINIKFDI